MRQKKLYVLLAALVAAVGGMASPAALADKASDEAAIARYREMIADGNPAELVAGQGEELWKTKRGPKNASLEKCDLGLGPGVLKGTGRRAGRGTVENQARPEECQPREMRSRPWARCRQRGVRQVAALFQGHRQGAGSRDAFDDLHGNLAGYRSEGDHRCQVAEG